MRSIERNYYIRRECEWARYQSYDLFHYFMNISYTLTTCYYITESRMAPTISASYRTTYSAFETV